MPVIYLLNGISMCQVVEMKDIGLVVQKIY